MDEHDELFGVIREKYDVGYYNYCLTVTFKSDIDYAVLHPKKACERFGVEFSRYLKKRSCKYVMFPEISTEGMLHYHGIIMFKSVDYAEHEKTLKLFRNWLNRKFGRNQCQRMFSLRDPYKVACMRTYLRTKEFWTSFESIWRYITKDRNKFPFLSSIIFI